MAAAWEQAQAAIEVNRMLNRGRLGEEAALQSERKWARSPMPMRCRSPRRRSSRCATARIAMLLIERAPRRARTSGAFRRLGRLAGRSPPADVPAAQSPAVEIARTVVESGRDVEPDVADPLSVAFRTRYLPPAWTSAAAAGAGAGGTASRWAT